MSGKINILRSYILSKHRYRIGGRSLSCAARYNGETLNDMSVVEKEQLEEAWFGDDIDGQLEHASIHSYVHRTHNKKYYSEQNDGPIGATEKE